MFSRVVSMGGAVYTQGNITPWAEANIYKDTRAASIVLDSVPNLVLVPLDVTQTLFLSKEEAGKWNDGQYRAMTDFYIAFHGGDRCYLHDPTTIAYLANLQLFMTERLSLEVVQDGPDGLAVLGEGDCETEALLFRHLFFEKKCHNRRKYYQIPNVVIRLRAKLYTSVGSSLFS